MPTRIKLTGVVALVVGLVALNVSTALASQFRAEEYPTTLTAAQTAVTKIQIATGKIRCATYGGDGTASEAASTLALVPVLSDCNLAGQEAVAAAQGCEWVYHSTNESTPLAGAMDLRCGVGGSLSFEKEGCTVTIPSQESLEGAELVNEGVGDSRVVAIHLSISDLRYTESGPSCAASGEHSSGTITGASTVSGSSRLRSIGVYVAPTQIDAPHHFSVEYPSADVHGVGLTRFVLSFDTAKIGCHGITGSGFIGGSTQDLALHPTLANCTVAGTDVPIVSQSCSLVLHASEASAGTFGIACEAGHEIEANIQGLSCTVRIPAQSLPTAVSFADLGTGTSRNVEASIGVAGLEYSEQGPGCYSPGIHADGGFVGKLGLSATERPGGAPLGIWVE